MYPVIFKKPIQYLVVHRETHPPPPHLRYTGNFCNAMCEQNVTIYVWCPLKCHSAPGKMVSFSQR